MCDCKECQRGKLRTEPATELELHRMRRARETGKVKNPTWYRLPALPAPFEPDLRQKYPSYVRAMFTSLTYCPPPVIPGDVDTASTEQYVRAFESLNGLKQA